MKGAESVPRLPYAAHPVRGIPGEPLEPIQVLVPAQGVAHAWATLYAHLHGLQTLYARIGLHRPLGRLHDLTTSLTPVVTRAGGVSATRASLSAAIRAVDDLDAEELAVLINAQDAGWWIVALQASYALGIWYALAPGAERQDVELASQAALLTRQILASVFDRRIVDAIQDAAHGAEAIAFLGQVVEGALILEAPLRGIPESMEEPCKQSK